MAVQPHRNTWTDERLDDLSQSIRDGFVRNDAEHLEMRKEIREGFARVEGRIDGLDRRFDGRLDALDHRFDTLQRTLILALSGLIAAIIAAAATVAGILG